VKLAPEPRPGDTRSVQIFIDAIKASRRVEFHLTDHEPRRAA
jgi:hypothetical protein